MKCIVADSGIKHLDIRFPRWKVPAEETTYLCMIVDMPTDGDYHMVANTPLVDNKAVLHHMLLYGCNEDGRLCVTIPVYDSRHADGRRLPHGRQHAASGQQGRATSHASVWM